MTSFVNDSGEYLDYSGEDFGLTKQVATWHDFKIKGDVSVDLKIPNTAENRARLNYYGAQQDEVTTSSDWTVVKNGNKIMRGSIVIKGNDALNIECFFISGNANWFNSFQFSLKEIDFPDSYTVGAQSFDSRKASTEGIIFPVVDWWAQGQHRGWDFVINANQTQEEQPVFHEIHPCLFLHTIVTEMCNFGGVKMDGDLFTDPILKKMIITNDGPDIFWPDWVIEQSRVKVEALPGLYAGYPTVDNLVQWGTILERGTLQTMNTSTYGWTAPRTATVKIELAIEFNVTGHLFQLDMWKNGAFDATVFNMTLVADRKFVTFFYNVVRGDVLTFYITNTDSPGSNFRLSLLAERSTMTISIVKPIGTSMSSTVFGYPVTTIPYVPPMAICPDMKAVDLVKFLCMYFGAVCSYDEYSKKLTINKLSRFQKEDAEDWSEYFVSQKTIFQTGVCLHNYIQFGEGPEAQIEAYNKQSKITYGGGEIQTDIGATFERTIYNIPFLPSWDQRSLTGNPWMLPYIKYYDLTFEESTTYSGVASSGGRAQLTATFQNSLDLNAVYFVKSNTGVYTGFATLNSSASVTTNPILNVDYDSNDTGTIVKYSVTKVTAGHRLLLCYPGTTVSDAGGPASFDMASTSSATGALSWFDKPITNENIDVIKDSLAIDNIYGREYNHSAGEKYHSVMETIYNNPKIDAYFLLPASVFESFDFQRFVYIKTKDLTGYFFVQKIDQYKDSDTPVKVELLYVD